MKRYIQQIEKAFEKEELGETKSVAKPKPQSGYEIKRAMVADPNNSKRRVKGWVKTAKVKKNKVGGMTRAQRRIAAKKAVRTKKTDPKGQRIAKKRAALTRKKTKQMGLNK